MSKPLCRFVRAALACAVVACLAGCGAEVKAFSAVPRHICAGEPVDLRWSVVGSPRIAVAPPSATLPDGPVSKAGHATIAPSTNTRVELHVTRAFGNPTTSVQEVLVTTATTEPLTASSETLPLNRVAKEGASRRPCMRSASRARSRSRPSRPTSGTIAPTRSSTPASVPSSCQAPPCRTSEARRSLATGFLLPRSGRARPALPCRQFS